MLCRILRNCLISVRNVDQPGRLPVFKNVSGSTDTPGVSGYINYDKLVSVYEVFTVPADKIFVLEHVSAVVTRGDTIPYPAEYLNDYGAVGYVLNNSGNDHYISFVRSEPGGILQTSQSMRLYIPSSAGVIVKVPLVPDQSGGADINVSGYYINT